MIYCDLGAAPKFYHWSEPTARKEYKCCECSAPIQKGERHFKATGKWEGEIDTFRQHLRCMQACIYIRDAMSGGECIAFGALMEWYGEMRVSWQYNPTRARSVDGEIRLMLAGILKRQRAANRATEPHP